MADYQIFTDATADLSPEMLSGLPPVEMIPMEVEIGGRVYTYGPSGTITPAEFYRLQREGHFSSTSQITPQTYRQYFEPVLQDGRDILYLCFSSGLSGTFQSAELAINELRTLYPERSIACIDTLAASIGEGLLVCEALKRQAEGCSLSGLASWVRENRLKVCHWFTVDTFDHLRHGGRVSAAAAVMGTALQIKPLLHVDEEDRLKVAEKPRGHKKALHSQIRQVTTGWEPEGFCRRIVVAHGDNPEGAKNLMGALAIHIPEAEFSTSEIGPVIGSHTGPGMLAVTYIGTNR